MVRQGYLSIFVFVYEIASCLLSLCLFRFIVFVAAKLHWSLRYLILYKTHKTKDVYWTLDNIQTMASFYILSLELYWILSDNVSYHNKLILE